MFFRKKQKKVSIESTLDVSYKNEVIQEVRSELDADRLKHYALLRRLEAVFPERDYGRQADELERQILKRMENS